MDWSSIRNRVNVLCLWARHLPAFGPIELGELWVPSSSEYLLLLGVHLLRMTPTSSLTLKVGFTVAEEANAWVALSATKWALINRIRNWAEHWSMLMSATVSDNCSTIVFIVKVWHFKGTGRSQSSSVGCKSLQPANRNVAPFKDRLDVILEAFLLSTNTPTA